MRRLRDGVGRETPGAFGRDLSEEGEKEMSGRLPFKVDGVVKGPPPVANKNFAIIFDGHGCSRLVHLERPTNFYHCIGLSYITGQSRYLSEA